MKTNALHKRQWLAAYADPSKQWRVKPKVKQAARTILGIVVFAAIVALVLVVWGMLAELEADVIAYRMAQ